jgi:hypothetical protein
MAARTPPIPAASTFFFGPPDRRRRRAGRRPAPHPSPHPERRPQPEQVGKPSAVRETSYARSVELGIPSKEPASYRGHVARDMRAAAEASRTGRPPREGARNMKATSRTFLIVLAMATILATVTTGAAVAGKSSSSCAVSPNPVASGAALTVSGRAGHSGNWVNAYIYYSDGYWELLGGSVGGGGSFSLSGMAQETHTSLWGPFYPASSGGASVEIYAGSANRDLGMVATCSFSVS